MYYEDTDAGGIVYYANYLKFAERARTEILRAAGIRQHDLMHEEGIGFVVRRCEMIFHKPARLDDVITVETRLERMEKSRIEMRQQVKRETMLLVDIDVQLVCVGKGMRPCRIPEPVTQALR